MTNSLPKSSKKVILIPYDVYFIVLAGYFYDEGFKAFMKKYTTY